MTDSPTRRSSIPILKQTNKTKSFQSFVNLKIIDNADPSGRIHSPASMSSLSPPILEYPKVPPKPQARAVPMPKLEIDNDIIITKLCEENKRVKEHQIQLLSKYEEALRENMEIQNKNEELQKEAAHARREVSEKIHLQKTVENLLRQQAEMVERNKKLQKKLEEMIPDRVIGDDTKNHDDELSRMMGELEKLKSYLTNAELQLYEANENIADLLEKKQELEEANMSLKIDNTNLNSVVRMMQNNLSVDVKRKEESFVSAKPDLGEVLKKNHNQASDESTNETLLKRENSQKRAFEAQFIEYV